MQDSLSNVFFTTKDAASLGSLPNCVVPVPMSIKYSTKRIIDIQLLWRISCILNHDFFRDLSDTINLIPPTNTVPNRRHICHPLGTTCFPFLCSFHIPLRHINKTHRIQNDEDEKTNSINCIDSRFVHWRAMLKSLHFSFVTHNRVQVMQ